MSFAAVSFAKRAARLKDSMSDEQMLDVGRRAGVTEWRRAGAWFMARCPFHADKSPSFAFNTRSKKMRCFACDAGGDVIDVAALAFGLSKPEALARLEAENGLDGLEADPAIEAARRARAALAAEEAARQLEKRAEYAEEILAGTEPGAGTLVEDYYRSRGLLLPVAPTTRFHPEIKHSNSGLRFPAMVSVFRYPDGRQARACHVTFLDPATGGKALVKPAKKIFGPWLGAAIWFGPSAADMIGGEGIETTLSALQVTLGEEAARDFDWSRWKAGLPLTIGKREVSFWAFGTLDNWCGYASRDVPRQVHPEKPDETVPPPVPDMERPGLVPPKLWRRFTWLRDMNGDPHHGAARVEMGRRRYRALGLDAHCANPGDGLDFNDVLLAQRRSG